MAVLKLGNKNKVVQLDHRPSELQKKIDELGHANLQRRHFEARETALKAELKTLSPGAYKGKMYDILVRAGTTTVLNREKLRELVSEEILKKCEGQTPYVKIEITAKVDLRNS